MSLDIDNSNEIETPEDLAARLHDGYIADAVDLLNAQEPAFSAEALLRLPETRAIDILDKPELIDPELIIACMPSLRAAPLLNGMAADRVAEVFRYLEGEKRVTLLQALDPEMQTALHRLLSFPEGTAGSIMTTEFVSVFTNWTVGRALRHIREVESTRETVYAIYILDPATRALVQSVALRRLITGEPDAPILSVARDSEAVTIDPAMPQNEVAHLIRRHDLLAVPVVDHARRMLGIVTVDDILDTIVDESTEDAHRFGGVEAFDEPYTQLSFGDMIRKRAGWLSILLVGEMLTASAMQHFEDELERAVVLTLFIPLIMSSGGNSGSQATSLLIRALALGEVKLKDWWRIGLRELPTGIMLGSILAVLGVARIVVWQLAGFYDYGEHWQLVAATVGAALIGVVTFGSVAGPMLPFILKRLGFDPASASAPFVATLVDVTGLVIYFTVALAILGGTLL